MEKTGKLKLVDKIIGTPLCYGLGIVSSLGRFIGSSEKPAAFKKILCIKTVALGDLVVALPTFKAVKQAFPNAALDLLTTPRVKDVVEGSPWLDNIIYFDVFGRDKGLSGLLSVWRRLRGASYDLVIDMEHYYRFTTLLAFFSGVPFRVGFNLPGQGRSLLFTEKVNYPVDKHEVEAFLELAKAVGAVVSDPELVPIVFSQDDERAVEDWLVKNKIRASDRLIGIHASTSPIALSRRWSSERFSAVANKLVSGGRAKVVFTGADTDVPLIADIRGRMNAPSVSAAGELTLKQFACLTKRFDIFISVDTGALHIAAAMGTRVLGLYGPNTPVKWGPYGAGNVAVYKDLDCSPCTKQYLGQVSRCQRPECMSAISVEDVIAAAGAVLSGQIEKTAGGNSGYGA